MTGLLAAAALLAACPSHDDAATELRGRVRDATARAPVAFAVVEVRPESGGGPVRTRTGPRGYYRVRGLPAGWMTVTVRHQGYRESNVRVRIGEAECLDVDFTVRLDPVELPSVRVHGLPAGERVPEPPGSGSGEGPAAAVGPGAPELAALQTSPFGGAGLGPAVRRAIRPQPADPSVLFLRGTTVPFQQILLDGAPVHTPFHLAGLLASYPPDVIGSSRLRSGGPEPRYGGGLLYTLDLRTRSPGEEAWSAGSVDVLGTSARAAGPVAGGEYLVSGRSLHPAAGAGGRSSLEGRRHADGLVRLSAGGDDGVRGSATGFWNRASTPLTAEGSRTSATWENAAGSLRLASGGRDHGWRSTLAASRYRSGLPVTAADRREIEAGVREQRAVIRRVDRRGELEWGGGGALRRKTQDLRLTADSASSSVAESGAAGRIGGFASARWHVSERVSLRGGLRVDRFSLDGSVRAAPRAAATLRVSPETTVRLSAGRVHQIVAAWSGSRAGPEAPDSAGASLRPAPLVAGASRFELRLEHRGRDGLRLGGEAHYRQMEGISTGSLFDTVTVASAGSFDPGVGGSDGADVFSSGLELWGAWRGDGVRLRGSYSLSWLWAAAGSDGVSARFAARQVLSGRAGAPLPGGVRARVSLAGSWGLPMTPLPVSGTRSGPAGSSPDGVPDGGAGSGTSGQGAASGSTPYFRLDGRLERSFSVELFGGSVRLTPYAKLINALDRQNSRFQRLPAPGGDLQPVNPVPALPVVGIEWSG